MRKRIGCASRLPHLQTQAAQICMAGVRKPTPHAGPVNEVKLITSECENAIELGLLGNACRISNHCSIAQVAFSSDRSCPLTIKHCEVR